MLTFLVLDAETTGFKFGQDRILSLAIMPIRRGDLQVGEAAGWVVFQSSAPVNAASSVHGILPSETAAGTAEREVLVALLPRRHGAVVVGRSHRVRRRDARRGAAAAFRHRLA